MTWLALLLALFLEQMSFAGLRARIDGWAVAWPNWALQRMALASAGTWQRGVWMVVAVLGPALLAQMLYGFLGAFFGWFLLLFVLFAALGFGVYLRVATVLREALEWGDEPTLRAVIDAHAPNAATLQSGLGAQALASLLWLAQQQLLAVLIAVVLGWLFGLPVFFVVLLWSLRAWAAACAQTAWTDERGQRGLELVDRALAWVTAVTLGLGSQFDAVLRGLRRSDAGSRSALVLLGDAAGAALRLPEDWMDQARAEDDEDAVSIEHLLRWDALVWRALGVWLLLFAVLSALAG